MMYSLQYETRGEVVLPDLIYTETQTITDFIKDNRQAFKEELLNQAGNVRDKIEEIKRVSDIDLIQNAHEIVLYVVGGKEQEVIDFGRKEGVLWAQHSLTVSFKLNWVQSIRKALWNFLYEFDVRGDKLKRREEFYEMEQKINILIAEFLKVFFISYSDYKDEQLEKQKQMVDNLSVPIIPISTTKWVLPLVGVIDEHRATIMKERILYKISDEHIDVLVMDLSGIAQIDANAIHQFIKIIDVVNITGCQCIMTGLRPEIVTEIVKLDPAFHKKVITKGTLRQALQDNFS